MFRADTRIIKACRDRIYWSDLTIFVLAEVRFHAVEDTNGTLCNCRRMFFCIDAATCRFTTDETNTFIWNEMIEHAHRIGATAYTSHNSCWQFSFCFEDLLTRFTADNGLEIANDHREWMSPHNGSQYIMRIGHAICPFAQCFGNRIFQCASPCCYRMHLSA